MEETIVKEFGKCVVIEGKHILIANYNLKKGSHFFWIEFTMFIFFEQTTGEGNVSHQTNADLKVAQENH